MNTTPMKHDDWTDCHDLALVYLALAYGPDHQIAERELTLITEALEGKERDGDDVQEVVMEALAVMLEEGLDSDEVVTQALDRLRASLSVEQRQRAVEELVRIAEADGLLLRTERTTIAAIAHRWEVKSHALALLDATRGDVDDWTLLHDIGLIYVILGHSTDGDLSKAEIDVLVERATDWHPSGDEESARGVLRQALSYYSSDPGGEALRRSIASIKHRLPLVQRLALIEDLYAIAEADGVMLDAERDLIGSLVSEWGLATVTPFAAPKAV